MRARFADLTGDVRAAVRGWRRAPGFSLTIVLTLVLGLASAIFAFADGYLFRPLPFPSPDRLFFVRDPDALASALKASDTVALRASPVGHLGFERGGDTPVPGIGDRPAGPISIGDQVQTERDIEAVDVGQGYFEALVGAAESGPSVSPGRSASRGACGGRR